jgi:hypothetical protein
MGPELKSTKKIRMVKLLTLLAGLGTLLILPACITETLAIWSIYSERSISFDRDDLKNLGRVAVISYSPTKLKIKKEVGTIAGTTLEETDFIEERGGKVSVGGQFRRLIGQGTFARVLQKRVYEKLKSSGIIELVSDEIVRDTEAGFITKQQKKEPFKPADLFKKPEEKQEIRPDYKIVANLISADTILEFRVEIAFIKPLQLGVISPNYRCSINIKGSMFRVADKYVFWRNEFYREDRITQMKRDYIFEVLIADKGAMLKRIIDRNSKDMAEQIYDDINIEGL